MVRLTLNLLKFAFKQAWSFIRFATPSAIRLLGVALSVSFLAVVSMFRGVDSVADVLATDWTRRAIEVGFPDIWQLQLYACFFVLAYCTVLSGWFILSFTMYFIVKFIR